MPDDFIDALNDCSQDADCWAVRTKPERETNSEVSLPVLVRIRHASWCIRVDPRVLLSCS